MRMSFNNNRRRSSPIGAVLFAAWLASTTGAAAQEAGGPNVTTVLSGNRFAPSELSVPAGRTFELVVVNEDRMVEGFQSETLRVERLVPGGKSITLRLGPLAPGAYPFHGQYHPETAQGRLIAR